MRHLRVWLRRLAMALLGVALLGGVLAGVEVYRYSFRSDPGMADAAIVLGAATWGTRPSPVYAERIHHALFLYRTGRVGRIILTGGALVAEEPADSQIAAAYAQERGAAAEDLFCDRVSRTTFENLLVARAIVQAQGWERVLVVSDPMHMRRSLLMAEDLGLDAAPSPTPSSRYRTWHSRGLFLLRETYFFSDYLLRRLSARTFRTTVAPASFACK